MKDHTIERLLGLLLAGIAAAALSGCGKENHGAASEQTLPKAAVKTALVTEQSTDVIEEVVGTVRARVRATVSSRSSGRIEELPVALGQRLKAGDLVAKLDSADIQARLEQAQANLQQAERDWQRTSALFKQQATTRAELDAAEARLQVTRAAVSEAQVTLGFARVTAPFDGVVTRKHAEAGDLAQPGKPLIELENPEVLEVEAEVPEALASGVTQGAALQVRIGDRPQTIPATVREIAPVSDPLSRTFQVKLDLPRTTDLMPGRFARLLVPVKEGQSLRVPAPAVLKRGQLELAFVVEDQQARLHLVKTGRRLGGEVEILSGLRAGETIVVDGAAQLLDGQPVAVNP